MTLRNSMPESANRIDREEPQHKDKVDKQTSEPSVEVYDFFK